MVIGMVFIEISSFEELDAELHANAERLVRAADRRALAGHVRHLVRMHAHGLLRAELADEARAARIEKRPPMMATLANSSCRSQGSDALTQLASSSTGWNFVGRLAMRSVREPDRKRFERRDDGSWRSSAREYAAWPTSPGEESFAK